MRLFILSAFLLIPACLLPQVMEGVEKAASVFFEEKDFHRSLEAYLKLNDHSPNDPTTLSKIGICYFETNQLNQSINFLMQSNATSAEPPFETYLFLGKCFHEKLKFKKAINHYKTFLKKVDQKHPLRAAVKSDILRCAVGLRVERWAAKAEVSGIGQHINSPDDDLKPLPSPNYSDLLYFSSNRQRLKNAFEPSFDMYEVQQNNGVWDSPTPLGLVINSQKAETPQSFSVDGSYLYFFRGETLFSGDILVDTFSENIAEKNFLFEELDSPMKAWEGDCDLQFFNNTTILFASRRPGGYGGLDIYISQWTENGWTKPENLGPMINSAYDDRSPHLAPDGRTLYFSTNDARRSIGGLDILKSYFLDRAGKWTPPENLGIPINSASDDTHFTLLKDGWSALFSSDRKSGAGGFDIYKARFNTSLGVQFYLSDPAAFSLVKNGVRNSTLPAQTSDGNPSFFDASPVFFDNPFMPLPEEILLRLENIAQWLHAYPALQIIFVAHTDKEDNGEFPTRSVLQQVKEFLKDLETPLHQIRFIHAGTNYPMARGSDRRVEIYVANPQVLPVAVQKSAEDRRSFQAGFFKKIMNSQVFHVLIPVNETEELSALLDLFPDGMLMEYPSSPPSFFSTGIYLTWDAAKEAEKEAGQLGLKGKAVPFIYGWEFDRENAEQYLYEFPQLKGFLEKR